MQQTSSVVRVGIGVFVLRDGKILMGKRKGSHGAATYALPGGHLELGETWEECAAREVMEETGLTLTNIRFVAVTNDIFENEEKHYVTLFMAGDLDNAQNAKLMEPNKCESWDWYAPDNLPKPTFLSLQDLMKQGFPKLF